MISMLKTKRLLLKLLAIFGIVLILNIVNRLESISNIWYCVNTKYC